MGWCMMQVRFPDGAIKFGAFNTTADVGNDELVDDRERWRQVRTLDRNLDGCHAVQVEVAVDYGDGIFGRTLAVDGHLGQCPHFIAQPGGYWDIEPNVTDVQHGLPDWWLS